MSETESEMSPRHHVGKAPFSINTTNIFLPSIDTKSTSPARPSDEAGIKSHRNENTVPVKSDQKHYKHHRGHRSKKSKRKLDERKGHTQEVNLLCISGNAGKDKDDLTLPDIVVDSARDSIDFKTTTPRFVNNYKRVMEKKGLAIEDMFSHCRHKPSKKRGSDAYSDLSMDSFTSSELQLPQIFTSDVNNKTLDTNNEHKVLSRMSETTDSDVYSGFDDYESEEHRRDIEKRFKVRLGDLVEEYEQTPGFKPRKTSRSRKLGGVVSSDRLTRMLEKNAPIKMESCYNYYLDD